MTPTLAGSHVGLFMLDRAGEKIAKVVRLSGMKCPIIPPRCQQAAVPQWKTANFEQYPYFIAPPPPPPQSVLR